MKRILCLLSALLFLLLPAAGCARDNTVKAEIADAGLPLSDMKAPPGLTISSSQGEIQALTPSFTWNGISADGLFVFDLWLGGELKMLSVIPNDKVTFRFEAVPDRMKVTAWKAECATEDHSRVSESVEIPIVNNSLAIPIDGEYLYMISAEWGETGSYDKEAVYVFGTSG